ncbi:MAG TPA: hypothetical protein VMS73_07785 [Anaerolineaceae bacterium]|nr:hypothetical protein [Anaerolineaceae bacterium]
MAVDSLIETNFQRRRIDESDPTAFAKLQVCRKTIQGTSEEGVYSTKRV